MGVKGAALATFIMQSSESVISVCFNSSLLKYGGDIAVTFTAILFTVQFKKSLKALEQK